MGLLRAFSSKSVLIPDEINEEGGSTSCFAGGLFVLPGWAWRGMIQVVPSNSPKGKLRLSHLQTCWWISMLPSLPSCFLPFCPCHLRLWPVWKDTIPLSIWSAESQCSKHACPFEWPRLEDLHHGSWITVAFRWGWGLPTLSAVRQIQHSLGGSATSWWRWRWIGSSYAFYRVGQGVFQTLLEGGTLQFLPPFLSNQHHTANWLDLVSFGWSVGSDASNSQTGCRTTANGAWKVQNTSSVNTWPSPQGW